MPKNRLGENIARLIWKIMPQWQQEHFIALREQLNLTTRNPKYHKITTTLLIVSTFNPIARILPGRPTGIVPGLWTAYHFCRKIDDIADGDTELPQKYESFSDMKEELKNAIMRNKYFDTDVEILLRGTIRDMKKYYGVDIREEISQFLDAMDYENRRRLDKTISTRSELFDLYQSSFGVPQDISLIGLGSNVRSKDIPELADLQGRLYAIRDLSDELPKGIVFVPRDVLPSQMTADELCACYNSNPNVLAWIQEELKEGKQLIDRLKQKDMDFSGRKIVNFLTKGIEKYIMQYSDCSFSTI